MLLKIALGLQKYHKNSLHYKHLKSINHGYKINLLRINTFIFNCTNLIDILSSVTLSIPTTQVRLFITYETVISKQIVPAGKKADNNTN